MAGKRTSVFGIGINDAEYIVTKKAMVDGKRKEIWGCPFYRRWKAILMRCYRDYGRSESYSGCEVCEEWKLFSNFKYWMERQDWEGKEIDKDLLGGGSRIYSPENCCFVSKKVNMLLTVDRGGFGKPCGTADHDRGFYVARVSNPFTGKVDYIGCFKDREAANKAWMAKKKEHAIILAAQESDPRVKSALVDFFECKPGDPSTIERFKVSADA